METQYGLSRRAAWAALAAIVIVSGLLRFGQIGRKELCLDECIGAIAARGTLAETAASVAEYGFHPPFYYLALNLTARLTGDDEVGLRVLSGLASVGTVVLTYVLGAVLLNRIVGLLASGAVAVSSFQLYFAQEVGPDALVTLLVLAMTAVFVRIMTSCERPPRALWPWFIAYGLLIAASLYTHYYALFAVVAHGVAFCVLWLCARYRSGKTGGHWLLTARHAGAVWPMLLAAAALGGAAFGLGWGDVVLGRFSRATDVASSYHMSSVGGAFRQFVAGPVVDMAAPNLDWLTLASLAVLAVVPLVGVVCALRSAPGAALALALFALAPFACFALVVRSHVFESRDLVFVAPFVFVMIAAGGTWARARMVTGVVLVLVIVLNAAMDRVYLRAGYAKERWRRAACEIQSAERPGDMIVVTPSEAAHALGRYYKGELPLVPVERSAMPRALASMSPRRVWLVEFSSSVAYPDESVARRLLSRAGPGARMPSGKTFEGFTMSRNRITVRLFPRRRAGKG